MKVLKLIGSLLLVVVVAAVAFYLWAVRTASAKYERRWTAHTVSFPIPFPLDSSGLDELRRERIAAGASAKDPLAGVDLAAAAEARAVKNGERLIQSRLGCAGCHGKDFGGAMVIDVPVVAHWSAPNLTRGQGSVTNGFGPSDWDLAVRHGIRHTGQTSSMPSLDFEGLADHDLSDVIAYIRSLPPVDRLMKPVSFGPVFSFVLALDKNALLAFNMDHQTPHRVEPPPQVVSTDLGHYIAQTCRGCHNPKLTGGKLQGDPSMPIVANLTPDSTGLKGWTEADFVRALREGKRPDGSAIAPQMPTWMYGKMNDVEIQSVWAYLQTLPPMAKGAR